MGYIILDNGIPARFPEQYKISPKWSFPNTGFETFEEANEYAQSYLGDYAGIVLEVNIPVDYNGYGDKIEIREI